MMIVSLPRSVVTVPSSQLSSVRTIANFHFFMTSLRAPNTLTLFLLLCDFMNHVYPTPSQYSQSFMTVTSCIATNPVRDGRCCAATCNLAPHTFHAATSIRPSTRGGGGKSPGGGRAAHFFLSFSMSSCQRNPLMSQPFFFFCHVELHDIGAPPQDHAVPLLLVAVAQDICSACRVPRRTISVFAPRRGCVRPRPRPGRHPPPASPSTS